ncbi:putative PHD finger domain protein [Aspergillus homomorphus CBS 101889]|uniref:Putative PHD finger domain protein n=1 Tax=Aspergillus homomorphus (strain CBS 101889) TaxID=1450537 RepID=A0A395HST5_ASPHC|nr:putative PHD finger domain protein [Aspergillus homomorphus CBS 101889]RAL09918.1 putative PHD finger domain protein [Aspergillus homomorphus CBS 101889]
MSQQNGGGSASLASIEAAPPTHGLLRTITSGSHSSASSLPHNIGSPSVPSSSNTTRSSNTPSRKVDIPRLSAATTELLARVTGNLKGTQQRYDNKFIRWNPLAANRVGSNPNSHQRGAMRASSTIIELPTAPFTYSSNVVPPAVSPSTATSTVTRETPSNSTESLPQTTPSTARPLPAAPPIPESPKAALPPALVSLRPTQPEATSSATNSPLTASSAFKSKRPTTNGCRKRNSTTNGAKNKRRRRNRDSDDESVIRAGDSSSDESDIAPTATQTKSGRQVNRPSLYVPPPSVPAVVKETSNCLETSDNTRGSTEATRKRKRVQRKAKDVYVTCTRCQRGHSPLSNAIVFCDECNGAWHQLCHDPPIGLEVVTVKEKEWVCGECKPVPITIVQPTVVRSNPTLARAHPVSIPASSLIVPRAEVSAEGYSAEERRGFLSGLSHATLVELLVSISGSNPTLPMFPANLKEYRSSRFSFRPGCSAVTDASTSVQVPIGETNGLTHTASSMEESTRSSTVVAAGDSTVPLSRTRYEELSDEESEYEFQEHRLYPRAGNGFRLPVGLDDMDILSEDPACPTFSYSLHGPAQVRAQMKQSVPVWGS